MPQQLTFANHTQLFFRHTSNRLIAKSLMLAFSLNYPIVQFTRRAERYNMSLNDPTPLFGLSFNNAIKISHGLFFLIFARFSFANDEPINQEWSQSVCATLAATFMLHNVYEANNFDANIIPLASYGTFMLFAFAALAIKAAVYFCQEVRPNNQPPAHFAPQ